MSFKFEYSVSDTMSWRGANIEGKFAYDIDSTSLTGATVKVFGSKTGFYATNIEYYSDTRTLLIDPVRDFKPGEVVSGILTRGIRFAGSGVDSVGITFSPTSYGTFEDSVIVTSYSNRIKPNPIINSCSKCPITIIPQY